MRFLRILTFAAFATFSCDAFAQPPSARGAAGTRPLPGRGFFVAPAPSATSTGGATVGRGGVLRAQGEYNESTSRANINNQEARSRSLDNDLKQVETHHAIKNVGESERAKDHAREREARDKYLAAQENETPHRLSSREFEPLTGEIRWPEALRSSQYDEQRDLLERLFQQRAAHPETVGLSERLFQETRDLQADLKTNIQVHPSHDYLAARQFLEGLANEIRAPAASSVAGR